MRKRLLGISILLVIALGAALWAWWNRAPSAQDPAELAWPEMQLKGLAAIEVDTTHGAVRFVRAGDGWRAEAPGAEISPRADAARLAGLVDFITANRPLASPAIYRAGEGEEYGFIDPTAQVRLFASGKGEEPLFQMAVGRGSELGDGVYAVTQLDRDRLLVLDKSYLDVLGREPAYYYDKRVLNVDENAVRELRCSGADGQRWAVRTTEGGFVFTGPEPLKGQDASSSEIRFLIHTLATLTAGELQLAQGGSRGATVLAFEVLDGAKKPHVLEIFQQPEEGAPYPARSGWQPGPFTVSPDAVGLLDRSAFEVQGRSVVDIDTSRLAAFRMTVGQQTLEAEKTDTGWVARGEEKRLLGIDMSLWRLTDLKFEAEPTWSLPESAQWAMTLEPVGQSGKTETVLTFYNDPQLPAGQCWLKVGQEGPYYPVSNQLLKDLQGQMPPKE